MRGRPIRILLFLLALPASSAARADISVALVGTPSVVYDGARDGCSPGDVPDLNARAFRDAAGRTLVFALHDANRPLVGPDLAHLKIECREVLSSPENPDPARYEDRNFLAATWTDDGRDIGALVHHEYHADHFGRCAFASDMACWYNTILAYRSGDGGHIFSRLPKPVVASAPFRQEVQQGRHRGFFNPSNIFAIDAATRWRYALIATTGWDGQAFGACLFRSTDPAHGGWRAWDGRGFTIRYDDPYGTNVKPPPACRIVEPFTYPVGAVVRHPASGRFVAVFQAKAGGAFPLSGFYTSTSRDLFAWSPPRLLLAAATLYDDLCHAGPAVVAYPSLIDPASPARNYDTIGDAPDLFFTRIALDGCNTGHRLLLRQRLAIHDAKPL